MKWQAIIIWLLLTLPASSQKQYIDFSHIDRHVQSVAISSPASLAKELTANCQNDLEKTRAIFRWIADNIAYRTQTPRSKRKPSGGYFEEPHDTAALKPLDERVAETVLSNQVAVCDGYARLFKTLCTYAGVKAETVSGYARTEITRARQRFAPNHTWNAVWIDSSWKLLDVTWAAGYLNRYGDTFIRFFDETYFLSSPEYFIREHYPDDLTWALMPDPPLMAEFKHSPFKQKSFVKYKITSYTPSTGVINAAEGDTVRIELESASIRADRQISPDPFLDTSLYNTTSAALLVPSIWKGNRTYYMYTVSSSSIQWLYLLYNDDLVLRYRLNVTKEKPSIAVALPNNP